MLKIGIQWQKAITNTGCFYNNFPVEKNGYIFFLILRIEANRTEPRFGRNSAFFFEDIAVPGNGASHQFIKPLLRMTSTKALFI